MKVSDLSESELALRLANSSGLTFKSGPFGFRIRSPIASVATGLSLLYADYPLLDDQAFADYTLDLKTGKGTHRWWRPQVRVVTDGFSPFEPLPISHAYAFTRRRHVGGSCRRRCIRSCRQLQFSFLGRHHADRNRLLQ